MHLPAFVASLYGDLFSSASVKELADGSLEITSAPGRYIFWMVALMILLPVSWWCWRRRIGGRLAPSVFFASILIPLLIVPGIARESVHVSTAGLTIRTGFWFAPNIREFPFTNIESIVERTEKVEQRRLPREDTMWHFHYRTGKPESLVLSDLLDANRAPVIEYFRRHRIPFRES